MSSPLLANLETADLLRGLRQMSVEELLLPVLIQLAIIILVARLFSMLFRKVGQPAVVGEIAAGLILGPSVLGYFCPGISEAIFHPHPHSAGISPELFDATLNWVFSMLSQIGLILLLFVVGLEFDFRHLRANARATFGISAAGILLPFALGLGIAWLIGEAVLAPGSSPQRHLGFGLFMGTALSITALPVLGRMLLELNLTKTRIGVIAISAAAMDDAVGWTLLAAVTAVVGGGFQPKNTFWMTAETLIFALLMLFVARPLLARWARSALQRNHGELGLNSLAVLIGLIFGCSIITNLIGIFAIFGAFLLGAVLSAEEEFREAVCRRLRDFITIFFLPIFFTYTGLRTNINSLGSLELWMWCGIVIVAGTAGKLIGCGVAARLSGLPTRESICIGGMMNARGLMELIVVNVGYDLGVIPSSVFCMLVMMALVTTIITTPLLLRLMPGTELEPAILQSELFVDRSDVRLPVRLQPDQ